MTTDKLSTGTHVHTARVSRPGRVPEQVGVSQMGTGKAIPVKAWTSPEGSRRLGLPDFKTKGK